MTFAIFLITPHLQDKGPEHKPCLYRLIPTLGYPLENGPILCFSLLSDSRLFFDHSWRIHLITITCSFWLFAWYRAMPLLYPCRLVRRFSCYGTTPRRRVSLVVCDLLRGKELGASMRSGTPLIKIETFCPSTNLFLKGIGHLSLFLLMRVKTESRTRLLLFLVFYWVFKKDFQALWVKETCIPPCLFWCSISLTVTSTEAKTI